MSIIRIEKTKDYTIMSNHHFKEKEMSLKAKGLLSLMLSLPDNWDYTVAGLVAICKENETAIKSALNELKEFRYLEVIKKTPKETESGRIEYKYIIHEQPLDRENNEKQEGKKQGIENLPLENPNQLNTNILNINNKNNINTINSINMESENSFDKNISTTKKEKELTKKQIEAIKRKALILEYTDDKDIRQALIKYEEFRKTRGLTLKQWKDILTNLRDISGNKKSVALEIINKAYQSSWNNFYPVPTFNGKPKTSYSSKSSYVDNTANHNIRTYHISDEEFDKLSFNDKIKEIDKFDAVADMTEKQKEFHNMYCLARDENGNLLKF